MNDHELRSEFVRQLTLRQLRSGGALPTMRSPESMQLVPRTLVQYWDDADTPADVRRCLDTWAVLGGEDVSIRRFDDTSARAYIEANYGPREVAAFDRCRHPAMRSDYFRMCFIAADGGLYVDADDALRGNGWRSIFRSGLLKVQALCYDIKTHTMLPTRDIRRADLPIDQRVFYVNNNPLAAPAGHPIVQRALVRSTDILLGKDPYPEIQATTGPGNLTASLATHAHALLSSGQQPDFELLLEWDEVAETQWDLGYRSGPRNWRNMDRA